MLGILPVRLDDQPEDQRQPDVGAVAIRRPFGGSAGGRSTVTEPRTAAKHGTYARAQRHLKDGDLASCIACKEAARQYQANYRASSPERRQRVLDGVKAGLRAKTRLKDAHPEEYRRYYFEELKALEAEGKGRRP